MFIKVNGKLEWFNKQKKLNTEKVKIEIFTGLFSETQKSEQS